MNETASLGADGVGRHTLGLLMGVLLKGWTLGWLVGRSWTAGGPSLGLELGLGTCWVGQLVGCLVGLFPNWMVAGEGTWEATGNLVSSLEDGH